MAQVKERGEGGKESFLPSPPLPLPLFGILRYSNVKKQRKKNKEYIVFEGTRVTEQNPQPVCVLVCPVSILSSSNRQVDIFVYYIDSRTSFLIRLPGSPRMSG